MTNRQQAADILATLYKGLQTTPNLPEPLRPSQRDEAYAIQEALVTQILEHLGGDIIGYKVACTSQHAQYLLHVDGPFYGRMFSATTFQNQVQLPAHDFSHRVMEPEFCIQMKADLPHRPAPYTAETILPYIQYVIPAIEIVAPRYDDFSTVGGHSLIADNAVHGASILGEPIAMNPAMDLSTHPVTLRVNGAVMDVGSGANVLGSPLNVMAWLANELQAQGKQLCAGEFIITGVATQVYLAEQGDTVEADFGDLGTVRLSFT